MAYIEASRPDYEGLIEEKRKPGQLSLFADLAPAVRDAWFVIEAVPEKLQVKIDIMGELDQLVQPDCIIATNSSSFKSSRMLEKVDPKNRHRVCSVH